jgi:hypothetical protein
MATPPDETPVRVRAKFMGFYGGSRVRPGQTFTVKRSELAKWMEPVTPDAPDELAAAREASPTQRGPGGTLPKARQHRPPPGGRQGLEPDSGI